MDVRGMREYVSGMYLSDTWKNRVKLMPDRQVIAIYKRMVQRGQKPEKPPVKPVGEQLSIFDL